jgi:hypothetical protein
MSTDIRTALENLLSRLDQTTDLTADPVPAWVDSYRAALAQAEGDFNHIELALPEEWLADAWNQQADEFNQWDSLDTSEQLGWAQDRAVAVDRNRRTALAQPGGEYPLPTNYINPEHQGEDLELLQTFYQACQSEGGTADEINLRGICAVLARLHRQCQSLGIQDMITWFREEAEIAIADECPVAAGRLICAATLLQQQAARIAELEANLSELSEELEG